MVLRRPGTPRLHRMTAPDVGRPARTVLCGSIRTVASPVKRRRDVTVCAMARLRDSAAGEPPRASVRNRTPRVKKFETARQEWKSSKLDSSDTASRQNVAAYIFTVSIIDSDITLKFSRRLGLFSSDRVTRRRTCPHLGSGVSKRRPLERSADGVDIHDVIAVVTRPVSSKSAERWNWVCGKGD
jgi:hypothetical protein